MAELLGFLPGACIARSGVYEARVASDTPNLNHSGIEASLIGTLPVTSRLALSYAPARHRMATLALLALDARLANLLRHSREPMLAQLRMSWWRETLGQDAGAWPAGEPLLASLHSWQGRHGALAALVDGWEALCGPAPLAPEALKACAEGRGAAFAALAQVTQCGGQAGLASQLGTSWGLHDLAMRLGNDQERAAARSLAAGEAGDRPLPRAPRPLRPVAVLRALAVRRLAKGDEAAASSPAALLAALRIGLLGR